MVEMAERKRENATKYYKYKNRIMFAEVLLLVYGPVYFHNTELNITVRS